MNSKRISGGYEFDSQDLPEKVDSGRLTALDALDSIAYEKSKKLDTLMKVTPTTKMALWTGSIPDPKLPDSLAQQMSSLGTMKDEVGARIANT